MLQQAVFGRLASSARLASGSRGGAAAVSHRLWGSQVGEKAEGLQDAAQEAVNATGAGKGRRGGIRAPRFPAVPLPTSPSGLTFYM